MKKNGGGEAQSVQIAKSLNEQSMEPLVQETQSSKKPLKQVNEKEEEYQEEIGRKAKEGAGIKVEMVNNATDANTK